MSLLFQPGGKAGTHIRPQGSWRAPTAPPQHHGPQRNKAPPLTGPMPRSCWKPRPPPKKTFSSALRVSLQPQDAPSGPPSHDLKLGPRFGATANVFFLPSRAWAPGRDTVPTQPHTHNLSLTWGPQSPPRPTQGGRPGPGGVEPTHRPSPPPPRSSGMPLTHRLPRGRAEAQRPRPTAQGPRRAVTHAAPPARRLPLRTALGAGVRFPGKPARRARARCGSEPPPIPTPGPARPRPRPGPPPPPPEAPPLPGHTHRRPGLGRGLGSVTSQGSWAAPRRRRRRLPALGAPLRASHLGG